MSYERKLFTCKTNQHILVHIVHIYIYIYIIKHVFGHKCVDVVRYKMVQCFHCWHLFVCFVCLFCLFVCFGILMVFFPKLNANKDNCKLVLAWLCVCIVAFWCVFDGSKCDFAVISIQIWSDQYVSKNGCSIAGFETVKWNAYIRCIHIQTCTCVCVYISDLCIQGHIHITLTHVHVCICNSVHKHA